MQNTLSNNNNGNNNMALMNIVSMLKKWTKVNVNYLERLFIIYTDVNKPNIFHKIICRKTG